MKGHRVGTHHPRPMMVHQAVRRSLAAHARDLETQAEIQAKMTEMARMTKTKIVVLFLKTLLMKKKRKKKLRRKSDRLRRKNCAR